MTRRFPIRRPRWRQVRDADGRLLFKYDPRRRIVEIQRRRRKVLVHLTDLEK